MSEEEYRVQIESDAENMDDELGQLHDLCLMFLMGDEGLGEDDIQRIVPAFVYLYQHYFMESQGVH